MPQAIVIGAHPAWELAGVYSHPHKGWWELELFEAITGQPGEMVQCKTVDLIVPADASVVIEGFVTRRDGAGRTRHRGRPCCSPPMPTSSRCSR